MSIQAGHGLKDLVDRLQAARSSNLGGYRAFDFEYVIKALEHVVKRPQAVLWHEWPGLLRHAAFRVAGENRPITSESLLRAINALAQLLAQRPSNGFRVVSSLIPAVSPSRHRYSWKGMTITMYDNLPKKFASHIPTGPSKIRTETPSTKVVLSVIAQSETAAYDTTMRSLDFLRGCWNFIFNRYLLVSRASDENDRLNRVLSGPFQTVHHVDGRRASDLTWYDPFFLEPSPFRRLRKAQWIAATTEYDRIRRMVTACAYGEFIESALVRYCRALDNRDPGVAFLRLWSVLELLTNTVNARYDDLTKRAASLFADYQMHRSVLERLRDHRNRSVHAGFDDVGRSNLVMLHRYVAATLELVLATSNFFRSPEELGGFMDQSTNVADLLRARRVLDRAIRFRRERITN